MTQSKTWIVTTSADRPIRDVARDLADAGFSVGQVLEEVGSITGDAAEDSVGKLRAIPGVVDVSPDMPINIGPPDSPETW